MQHTAEDSIWAQIKKKKRRHVKCKSMMDEEERAIEGRQGGLQLEKVAVRE